MKSFIATFSSKIKGFVVFTQSHAYSPVHVTFRLTHIPSPPGTIHAIHIHEYGDLRKGCQSLGGHWNPTHMPHGSLEEGRFHHVGDLINNLQVQAGQIFFYDYEDPFLTLFGKHSILGRSVVIHHGVDDLGKGNSPESKITGNAGTRLDCAIIGWTCPTLSSDM